MPVKAKTSVSRQCACAETRWNVTRSQWKVRRLALKCQYVWSFRYSEALKLYEEVLGDQPTSVVLWKRKVAVFKARGDIDKAVAELNTLLTV